MTASPCINICKIEHGVCAGCLRSLDEIALWSNASDAEKRRILALVAQRRISRDSGPVCDAAG